MVTMVDLDLRAHPGTSSLYTYHHSHHWGNVAVPHGHPSLRMSATLSPQLGGKTTKFVRTGGGTGERERERKEITEGWRKLCNEEPR